MALLLPSPEVQQKTIGRFIAFILSELMGTRSTGIFMEPGIFPWSNSAGDLTSIITAPRSRASFILLLPRPNRERIDIGCFYAVNTFVFLSPICWRHMA